MDRDIILRLLEKMQAGPRDIMRTSESIYKTLNLKNPDLSDEELIDLLVQHPDLVQRPIVEIDDRAVLGRPTENIVSLLDEMIK